MSKRTLGKSFEKHLNNNTHLRFVTGFKYLHAMCLALDEDLKMTYELVDMKLKTQMKIQTPEKDNFCRIIYIYACHYLSIKNISPNFTHTHCSGN